MSSGKKEQRFDKIEFINQLVITLVLLSIATAINCIVVFSYESMTNVSGVFLLSVIMVSMR